MPADEVMKERPRAILQYGASKVPEVTVAFWVTKALTTGTGESSSDYLVHRLPPVLAVVLGGVALTGALAVQLAARRYVPWINWLAVAIVGVFGTMAADVLHVGLGAPNVVSTAFFAVRWRPSWPSGGRVRRPCQSTASTPDAARSSTGPR